MNIIEPRCTARIVNIVDTRSWWQKSALSRMNWPLIFVMTAYWAAAGAIIGALAHG